MDKITLEKILYPISVGEFFKKYWKKKHLILRRNKFKDIYGWEDLELYLNRYPYVRGLQIIDYDDNDTRWCHDKVMSGKLKLPKLSKKQVFDLWRKGKTFVIPFAEQENKKLHDIVYEFENYFHHGQVNIYASPVKGSKSFPAHKDGTENFLFHTHGKVKWTFYKDGKDKEILEEVTLEAGDLVYIPIGMYHKVDAVGPRILCSIHFKNKPNQSLEKFKIQRDNNRPPWYKWSPLTTVKIPKKKVRLMNKSNWSKPYFNKL
tara:strand:- start:45 stop:827 length:783 start_codon:yes stop_codon:yes gene_type:complete